MLSRFPMTFAGLLAAAAIIMLHAAPALAQEESERSYKVEAEAGASLFFGATSQTTVAFKGSADYHGWERFLLAGRAGYDYGESQDAEQVTFVNKRFWIAEASLDYLPGGSWSPFVSGVIESSLERLIDRRYGIGAGVRWTPIDGDGRKLDFGAGLKLESTTPRVAEGETVEKETLGRIFTRGELIWPLTERLTYSLVAGYEPAQEDFGNYTVAVDTGLAFSLNDAIALKISLVDRYDSGAKDRGALSNNDGRLFFSIIAGIS